VKVVTRVVGLALRGVSVDEGLFYSAKFLVQVAQNLLLAALFVMAGASSHAAIGLSSLFVAMLLPEVLFGFLGGAIGDRIGPSRAFIAGSALRLAAAGLGVYLAGGAAPAWAIAFIYQSVSQVSAPAELALVRNLRADAPGRAHSVIVAVQYAGQGLGMLALAPAFFFIGGPHMMFAGAAIIFAVLTVVTIVLSARLHGTAAARPQPAREAFSVRHTLAVFREPLAREAVAILAMKSMIAEGIVVAIPLYMKSSPALGHWSLASLLIPGSIGTVAGLAWAASASSDDRARSVMRLSLLGMVVSAFAYAALNYGLTRIPPMGQIAPHADSTLVLALAVAFLLGMALASSVVSARAALTTSAPVGTQSRVFAVQGALSDTLVVVPLMAVGIGGTFAGSGAIFAALGTMGALVLVMLARPSFIPYLGVTEPSEG
jgi:MFS family permease